MTTKPPIDVDKDTDCGCDGSGWKLVHADGLFTIRVKVQCEHGRYAGLPEWPCYICGSGRVSFGSKIAK